MHVGPLRQSDEVTVREWAIAYLTDYLRHYAATCGRTLSGDDIAAHIDAHDLDSVLWHDVVHADYADTEYVGTMREGNAPLGMILATTRFDPFLRVPVGVVKWIYVAPRHRKRGISGELVSSARTWMKKQGIDVIETTLAADNEAALALYRKAGLEPLERRLAARA